MPKCLYCKLEMNFDNIVQDKKGIGLTWQETLYSCPHCKSILGISRGEVGG